MGEEIVMVDEEGFVQDAIEAGVDLVKKAGREDGVGKADLLVLAGFGVLGFIDGAEESRMMGRTGDEDAGVDDTGGVGR